MTEKREVSPWQSILAGAAAGGVESLLTYPTEYLKTRQQLLKLDGSKSHSPVRLLVSTVRQHGIQHLYTGSMAFCASNSSKSGVRFFTFDTARKWMPTDSTGKVTPMGTMCAGLIAGVTESVTIVTPGETLKTKIIDDKAGPKLYRSTAHAVRTILAAEGVSGLYRGVLPVTLKQSANAMVRFTSYNFLLHHIRSLASSSTSTAIRSVHLWDTVVAGALAGVVTVYATMPFDTVKTRLQAVDGHQLYKGSFDCMRTFVTREGVSALWRGTTPRLARLSISGAVSFTIYEKVVQLTETTWKPEMRV